jgi:hypothetical protein
MDMPRAWNRSGLVRLLESVCKGGKERFIVRAAGGRVLRNRDDEVAHALLWAQERAWSLEPGDCLTVEQQPLFGDPIPVFLVEKQLDEGVATRTPGRVS